MLWKGKKPTCFFFENGGANRGDEHRDITERKKIRNNVEGSLIGRGNVISGEETIKTKKGFFTYIGGSLQGGRKNKLVFREGELRYSYYFKGGAGGGNYFAEKKGKKRGGNQLPFEHGQEREVVKEPQGALDR